VGGSESVGCYRRRDGDAGLLGESSGRRRRFVSKLKLVLRCNGVDVCSGAMKFEGLLDAGLGGCRDGGMHSVFDGLLASGTAECRMSVTRR
jgi:hypothetical protein